MNWTREFWGVEFTDPGERCSLLGTVWMRPPPKAQYEGEPTRAILFHTRQQAREWCRAKQLEYAGRNDCCSDWRFRPVRVVERVERKLTKEEVR